MTYAPGLDPKCCTESEGFRTPGTHVKAHQFFKTDRHKPLGQLSNGWIVSRHFAIRSQAKDLAEK